MKRIWEKVKIAWWELWEIYEDDDDSIHDSDLLRHRH